MNESTKAHELYQKMVSKKGKFSIEFHNFSKYHGVSLEGGTHHWDHNTGIGRAELETKTGKILFEFSQVKKIS